MLISTWMYAESLGEESVYPQVGASTSTDRFRAVYWRCVADFFASSVRHNPAARHVLFSNLARPPCVGSKDLDGFLSGLGVEVIQLPYTFRPPEGYFGAWRNQFYVFDIIRYLSRYEERENCLLLDSDCVWIDSAASIEQAIRLNGLLTYTIPVPPDYPVNGLTRIEMQMLFSELLGWSVSSLPVYCGGELVAAGPEGLRRMDREIDPMWQAQLERYEAGLTKCNEEAQALSYIYLKLGVALGTANPFIKRIWTGLPGRFRNDSSADYGYVIWHAPVEKHRGLRRLFDEVVEPESTFWKTPLGTPFAEHVGAYLGIGRRSIVKSAQDVAEVLLRRVRRRFGGR